MGLHPAVLSLPPWRRNPLAFRYVPGQFTLAQMGATFSRASTATYVDQNGIVQTASSGTARDGHYISGVRSLLLEGQRTNLCLWSEDFSNAAWASSAAGVTVTTDQATAPDGNVTADKLDFAVTTSYRYQSYTLGSSLLGLTYTWSCWVWSPSKATIGLRMAGATTGTDQTQSTINLVAGANRVSISRTFTSADTGLIFGFDNRVGQAGDGLAGFLYAWGGQLEAGAFSSSYVKTTTVAVTRSADSLRFPWLYAPQAMTTYLKFVESGTALVGGTLLTMSTAGGADPRFLMYSTGSAYRALYNNSVARLSDTATQPAIGAVDELRGLLNSDGSVQIGQSTSGAAEVVGTQSAALALPAAWSEASLYLMGSGTNGFIALQSLKIALGVQSLATMRAA